MATITAGYHSSAEVNRNTLNRNLSKAAGHLESLATGKAQVSAAAKAIGNKLDSISKVLEAAKTNAIQGNAVLSVAQGGLNEIVELLGQAKALATQSISGALDDTARGLLQKEFNALLKQINNIAGQTRWNGVGILDGGLRSVVEAGTVAGSTSVLVAPPANTLDQTTDAITGFAEGTVQSTAVSGSPGAYNVTVKVVNQAGTQTFAATNFAEGNNVTMTLTNATTGATIAVNCAATPTAITDASSFKVALDTMFGTNSGGTPVRLVSPSAAFANGMASGSIKAGPSTAAGTYGVSHAANGTTLSLTDGVNVWTENVTAGAQKVLFKNGVSVDLTSSFALATANTMVKFTVSTAGKIDLEFQTAETEKDLLSTSIEEVTTAKLGIGFVSIDTASNAKIAEPLLDSAVTTVNGIMATLQAQKNQLDSTASNLGVAIENTRSAKATFLDADVAKEMTDFTVSSILGQISNAMVVQTMQQHRELVRLAQS